MKGGKRMKKWVLWMTIGCLLMLAGCGQEQAEEPAEPLEKVFATAEEGIAYYQEENEEILYQGCPYSTEVAILYRQESGAISALAFAEQPGGYKEVWGLANYGSSVTLTLEAPWEENGGTTTPYYEINCIMFEDVPTAEELEKAGFTEYLERNGKYFAVKLCRYEMQPVLIDEIQIS